MAGKKGRSGGRPIPDEIKKARGTFEPSRALKAAIKLLPAKLQPPDWFEPDALAEWARVVPLLESVNALTDGDLAVLSNYCSAQGIVVRSMRDLKGQDLVIAGERGSVTNPLVKIARDARAEALRHMIELGLTPSARTRVASVQAPESPKDEGDEFLLGPPQLRAVSTVGN